jgi:hypothetical protein
MSSSARNGRTTPKASYATRRTTITRDCTRSWQRAFSALRLPTVSKVHIRA